MKQHFELINSETKPVTRELVQEFLEMEAAPTDRLLSESRVVYLHKKAETGLLVTFHWATAILGNKRLRMNGQHSTKMLSQLNGVFPEGLTAHIDDYRVNDERELALLFRQFDPRQSSRSKADVSGAYQEMIDALADVPRPAAKLGAEAICWYRKQIEKAPAPSDDDAYTIFSEIGLHSFLQWLGDLLSMKSSERGLLSRKSPELRHRSVVAAMYATYLKSESRARDFWPLVSRGGDEYEEDAATTILDNWLQRIQARDFDKIKDIPAIGEIYQGCIYSWNCHHDGITGRKIRYGTAGGYFEPK